jgi:hypothetical protein
VSRCLRRGNLAAFLRQALKMALHLFQVAPWSSRVPSATPGQIRCHAVGWSASKDLLRLAVQVGCGIVGAVRVFVISRFGKFLLEDVFDVGLCNRLQNLKCISQRTRVRVVAKLALASRLVMAPMPAFPEEDQRDKRGEKPKTERNARVDQDRISIAREERCTKRQGILQERGS